MVNRRCSSNNNAETNEANDITNNEAYEEYSTISSTSISSTSVSSRCNNKSFTSKNSKCSENTNAEEPQEERLNSSENGLSICSKDENPSAVIQDIPKMTADGDTVTEKLICSLPLERLTGILGTLAQSKRDANSSNTSSNSSNSLEPHNNKILCLYCDRTFSEKLYKKHAERVHKMTEGRRTSIRNNASTCVEPDLTGFPGCSFCPSGKKQGDMIADDLDVLFNHLVDSHKEKYFACKPCSTRFSNEDNLATHMRNVHNVETPKKLPLTKPLSVVVDFEEEIMARAAACRKDEVEVRLTRSAKFNHDRRNDLSAKEQMLIRLGIAHHRSPRTRKGAKNRRGATTEGGRSKSGRSSVAPNADNSDFVIVKNKNEVLNCTFDEDYYETVGNNVRLNLSCHLDGKLDSSPTAPSPLSPVAVCPTVRSTVVHSRLVTESEIHEATNLSTSTAFPTLLTADQYGADSISNKNRKPITKNSWKWKWDFVKKYKYVNEGGKIVKKVKQQPTGQRDLSKLDMWTQLVMRKKHEFIKDKEEEPCGGIVRQEKRRIVNQLNQILDTRCLPQIIREQTEQTVIKTEPEEETETTGTVVSTEGRKFARLLNLVPVKEISPAKVLLSGEWARPRCYVCFCCGAKFESLKHLEDHKIGRHPHVSCTHYEIVGRDLIENQIYNHLYLPAKALQQHNKILNHSTAAESESHSKSDKETISVEDSMDSVTSTSVSVLTSNTAETDTNTKTSKSSASTLGSLTTTSQSSPFKSKCSKCNRDANSILDLHRHMLDCSGDYAWQQIKKRMKYRRLLGKKRRTSRGVTTIRRPKSLSKTNDDDDEKEGGSPKPKPPSTPKVRPSDAESIQRMLANLPAKRTCRQILQLNNQTIRRKIQQKALPIALNSKHSSALLRKEKEKDESQETKKHKESLKSRSNVEKKKTKPDEQSNNNSEAHITNDYLKADMDLEVKEADDSKNIDKFKERSKEKSTEEVSVITEENVHQTGRKTRSRNKDIVDDDISKVENINGEDDDSSQSQRRTLRSNISPKESELRKSPKPKKSLLKKVQAKAKKVVESLGKSFRSKKVPEDVNESIVTTAETVSPVEEIENSSLLILSQPAEEPKLFEKVQPDEIVQPDVTISKPADVKLVEKKEDQIKPPAEMPVKLLDGKSSIEQTKNTSRRRNRKSAAPRPITRIIQADEDEDLISTASTSHTMKYQENIALNLVRKEHQPLPVIRKEKNQIVPVVEVIPTTSTELSITVTPPITNLDAFTPNSTSLGDSFTPLSSPALRTSTESLIKTPPGKRKVKKLNDCIAMLTGKLSDRPLTQSMFSPQINLLNVQPQLYDPQTEVMDLSAKSRPPIEENTITLTSDGVLDLSKKPAIRHSVESIISPTKKPVSPNMSRNHKTMDYPSSSKQSSLSYIPSGLSAPSDISPSISLTINKPKQIELTSHLSEKNVPPELIRSSLESFPSLELTPNVLSMIGLGLPLYPTPYTLSLSDFNLQQTSTPFTPIVEASKKRGSKKTRNLKNEADAIDKRNASSDLSRANKTIASIDTIVDSIEAVIKQSVMEAERSESMPTMPPHKKVAPNIIIPDIELIRVPEPKKAIVLVEQPQVVSKLISADEVHEEVVEKQPIAIADPTVEKLLETEKNLVKEKNDSPNVVDENMPTDFEELIDNERPRPKEQEIEIVQDEGEKSKEGLVKKNKVTIEENVQEIKQKKSKNTQEETSIENENKNKVKETEKEEEEKPKETKMKKGRAIKSKEASKTIDHEPNEIQEKTEQKLSEKSKPEETSKLEDENKSDVREKPSTSKPAKIDYSRRKSIRLLGFSPELGSFDDEPLELPIQQKKKTPSEFIEAKRISPRKKKVENNDTASSDDEPLINIKKSDKPDAMIEKSDRTLSKPAKKKNRVATEILPLKRSTRSLGVILDDEPKLQKKGEAVDNQSVQKTNNENEPQALEDILEKENPIVKIKRSRRGLAKDIDCSEATQSALLIVEIEKLITPAKKQPQLKNEKPEVTSDKSEVTSVDTEKLEINNDEQVGSEVTDQVKIRSRSENRKWDKNETNVETHKETISTTRNPKKTDILKEVVIETEKNLDENIQDTRRVRKTRSSNQEPDDVNEVTTAKEVTNKSDESLPKVDSDNENKTEKNHKEEEHSLTKVNDSNQEEDEKQIKKQRANRKSSKPTKKSSTEDDGEVKEVPKESIETDNTEMESTIRRSPKNPDTAENSEDKSDKMERDSTKENKIQQNKVRKRRKNELAAIIADQLLESFKEVDKSRIDELKVLHDLSCEKNENNDELLVSAIRTTPIPRRKAAVKAIDAIDSEGESRFTSPNRKKDVASPLLICVPSEVKSNEKVAEPEIEDEPTSSKKNTKKSKPDEYPTNEPKRKGRKIDKPEEEKSIESDVKDKRPKVTKKKMVPPPVPVILNDEEISFKRTTRKAFAQEMEIWNKMKQATDPPRNEYTPQSLNVNKQSNEKDMQESEVEDQRANKSDEKAEIISDIFDILKDDKRPKKDTTKKKDIKKRKQPENPFLMSTSENLNAAEIFNRTEITKPVLNVFCKGLDLDLPKNDITLPSPVSSPTNSSRSIFLRPSALDKILDKSDPSEKQDPPEVTDPAKEEPEKIPSAKRRISNRLSKSGDRRTSTAFQDELNFNDDEFEESAVQISELVNNLINQTSDSSDSEDELSLSKLSKPKIENSIIPNDTPQEKAREETEYAHTNTDLIDMDIDDDASVITDYTICRNETEGKVGSKIPRKRKHRRPLLSRRRTKVHRIESTESLEEFNCDLCQKVFKKADSLSKHKMTLSHIAKLSELEYLNSQKQQKPDAVVEDSTIENELTFEQPESPIVSKPNTPDVLLPDIPCSSPVSNLGIEPISSPEHMEPTYHRENSLVRRQPDNLRVALNPEERLFYEVCSMLKGSKADRLNSAKNSSGDQKLGNSVKSPLAHSRSSPKAAYPKLDANQFSDISSDSEAFARKQKMTQAKDCLLNMRKDPVMSDRLSEFLSSHHLDSPQEDHFSDTGDYSDDVSKKTLLRPPLASPNDKETPVSSPNLEKGHMYASSLHSTTSTGSNVSKIKTKAAMKGFDNFKVSISTIGLDLPNAIGKKDESKLVTLAEVALKVKSPAKQSPKKLRVTKSRTGKETSKSKPTGRSSPVDIYTFDDSQDFEEDMLPNSYRSKPSKPDKPELVKLDDNEESQQSSTSFSDRDDFVYGDNDPSSSDDSSHSSVSVRTSRKEPKKPDPVDTQKKSLIMGKIFKKRETGKGKCETPKPKIDRDQLFDILKADNQRQKEEEEEESKHALDDESQSSQDTQTTQESQETKVTEESQKTDKSVDTIIDQSNRGEHQRPNRGNIEEEFGMSMEQIEELIGVGSRKSKRRCASNKTKNIVETWSSDEYEEFHTTKDIIALIEDAEKKAQRKVRSSSKNKRDDSEGRTKELEKPKVVKKVTINVENEKEDDDDDDDEEETPIVETTEKPRTKSPKLKQKSKKKSNSKKAKNIAYDSDSDFERHIKKSTVVPKKPSAIKQRRRTIAFKEQTNEESNNEEKIKSNESVRKSMKKSKEAEDTLGRRKRNASEQLYYWSSSSDEEFGKLPSGDESNDSGDTKFQQHGWIVGDSHKRLVTLLAHAKAKKIDDGGVKEVGGGGKKK